VEADPPAFAVGKIILDPHRHHGADAGEGVGHDADQGAIAQAARPQYADSEAIEGDLRLASPKTQRLEAAPVPFDGQSVRCWERVMDEPLVVVQEPMNGADLYRKLAAEHSDLMRDASSRFLRMYHQRIVERYLLHAEDAFRLAASDQQ
jgi:hypothetical protein